MAKKFTLLLLFPLLFSLTNCEKSNIDEEITMYVGLGNTNSAYYANLQEAIYKRLGIKVNYVYTNQYDTTSSLVEMVKNNDLPADIVISAKKIDDEYAKDAFLDIASKTNLLDLFSSAKLKEYTTNGSIYSLPFTTSLIGITYNKTLLEELGLSLPNNYLDLVNLKKQVEDLGYPFAVSGGVATGHGFNYLLYVMGTDYIASPDGTEWLNNYIKGNVDSITLKEKSSYFKKYVESGLFGDVHYQDWNASVEFGSRRALFYYDVTSNNVGYDGLYKDKDGKIIGASYDEKGEVNKVEDANGSFVIVDSNIEIYDETKPNHQDLTRYDIPGAKILHDEFATMPFISENGSSNYYVSYDSMIISLDKKLGNKGYEDKLKKITRVLEFIVSEEAGKIYTDIYKSGYIASTKFEITSDVLYYDYKEQVESGFLMPWYYSRFDADTIVNVGEKVNKYILGEETFDSIFTTFDINVNNALNAKVESYGNVKETLDYQACANFVAICYAYGLNDEFKKKKIDKKIDISILPYCNSIKDLPVSKATAIHQSKLYQGAFAKSNATMIIASHLSTCNVFELDGKTINKMLSDGYDINERYGLEGYAKFNYTYVTNNNLKIEDNKTYNVAIPYKAISSDLYEEIKASQLTDISLFATAGFESYFARNSEVSKDTLKYSE